MTSTEPVIKKLIHPTTSILKVGLSSAGRPTRRSGIFLSKPITHIRIIQGGGV